MKTKYYQISGVTEKDIEKWSGFIDDQIRIFSILHKGVRTINIIVEFNKLEYIGAKIELFIFNLKHHTKLTIKSYK